jgi:1-acyl-sn-glycerol-3-phosphate acyltransferase
MIRNIVARILAGWVAIVFVITMLIFLFPIWLSGFWPEPKRSDLLIKIANVWMSFFFFLAGIRLTIRGRENLKKGETYIIICNHHSLMDVPLTSGRIPGPNKTIAKIEMARIPFFGIIYKRGSVLVDRKDPNSRRESFNKMKQVLDLGMHMIIYPEGARNTTNKPLKEFHDGAFRLAAATQKPVLPVVIFGTDKMLPNDKTFYFWPVKLEMHYLPAVEVNEGESVEFLKSKLFGIMWDYYKENKDDPGKTFESKFSGALL